MIPWEGQLELVRALTVHPHACQELHGTLKAEHFAHNPALGIICETILACYKSYHTVPTEGQIRTELSKAPEKLFPSCISLLPDVLNAEIPPEEWAIKTGKFIAARAELLELGLGIPTLADNGQFESALAQARKVSRTASNSGDISTTCGSMQDVIDRQTEVANSIPTKITRLDRSLPGGGLKRGSMGHVLGKKGGGKSHSLVHLGAAGLENSHSVLHITLEMPSSEVRARYDRHLLNACGPEFITKLGSDYPRLQSLHKRLTILEATKRAITCGGIEAAIDRMDSPPDIVIVDYLQLVSMGNLSSNINPGHARMEALGQMSQDLHIIAQERKIALWTAYQANRMGIQASRSTSEVLDTTHYAESIAAAWPAEVIISVNQSLSEAAGGLGRIFLAENRGGPSMKTIEVQLQWNKSKIVDLLDIPQQQVQP